MKKFGTALTGLIACISLSGAFAQEFPEGATAVADNDLKKRISDTVFDVKLADGVTWRLEYKSNGFFFVDTSRGFRGDGKWSIDNGKLCGQLRGRDHSCNELRLVRDILHMKRDSGEIVQLIPR